MKKPVGTQAVKMERVEEGLYQIWLGKFRNICVVADNSSSQGIESGLSHLESEHRESNSNQKFKSPTGMKILLVDETPVYQGPRRISYFGKCMVQQQIKKWLEEGALVIPPVVLVGKKNRSKRLCCDFRRLNFNILKDNFPRPLIDGFFMFQ